MNRRMTLILAAFPVMSAIAFGAACGGSGGGDVEALLREQARLTNERDYSGLFQTFDQDLRASCDFDNFVEAVEWIEEFEYGEVRYEDIRVDVDGDRATASYIVTFDGEEYEEVEDDGFIREDGRWVDDSGDADDPSC